MRSPGQARGWRTWSPRMTCLALELISLLPNFHTMKNGSSVFMKRWITSLVLWILFGFICVWLASGTNPAIWWTVLMWSILMNRFMIGFTIWLIGIYSHHPVFGFRIFPIFRWALFGAIVSIQMAIGVYFTPIPQQNIIFWLTIVAGAIYGIVIDFVATKIWGEGKILLAKNNM